MLRAVFCAGFMLAVGAAPAAAQATRTWVSGVGDDANPCSRTAPCKTFAGAISKTAAGGTISVLDPGGFGAVTITKSISIQTDPAFGSILASGTNGIIVNASANDDVVLNGLIIDGTGTGLRGLRILAARSVTITNCLIRGFRGSPGVAVDIVPTATTTAVTISNCTLTGNRVGVNSAPTGTGKAKAIVDNVIVERNVTAGIVSDGADSTLSLTDSIVKENTDGLSAPNGGSIRSFGNNVIVQNNPNGAPTVTSPLQ
jgi:hypothetical protein